MHTCGAKRYTRGMMSNRPGETRIEARVYGMVQGVFFRHATRIQALQWGLRGTVENLSDGTVRVIAQGDEKDLRNLLAWLGHGPELAHVERVDVQWLPPLDSVPGFRILR